MNDLKNVLDKRIGDKLLIFLKTGFRYEGLLLEVFDDFIQIKDTKKGGERFINFSDIGNFEVNSNEY